MNTCISARTRTEIINVFTCILDLCIYFAVKCGKQTRQQKHNICILYNALICCLLYNARLYAVYMLFICCLYAVYMRLYAVYMRLYAVYMRLYAVYYIICILYNALIYSCTSATRSCTSGVSNHEKNDTHA